MKNRPWVPFSQGSDLDFMLGHQKPAPEFKVGSLVDSPGSALQSEWECLGSEPQEVVMNWEAESTVDGHVNGEIASVKLP